MLKVLLGRVVGHFGSGMLFACSGMHLFAVFPNCFTLVKAIYVSHCVLEVVQRQSSLICLSYLTHRLTHTCVMACLYSTFYPKETEKRDRTND